MLTVRLYPADCELTLLLLSLLLPPVLLSSFLIVLSLSVVLCHHFLSSRSFVVLYVVSLGSFISYFGITFMRITNPKVYFEKKAYTNAVTEYRYIQKLFYIVASFIGFFLFLLFISTSFNQTISTIVILEFGVLYPVFFCLWIFDRSLSLRNEFYFYLAKACVKIVLESDE